MLELDESGPAAAGIVDDDERTVILGVEVTPVFSVARRKLGIDRAGCGLALLVLVPVLEADPFTLGAEPSLEVDELEVVEPAVPGLCTWPDGALFLSDVRVDVESWVPLLPTDATESAGLDLPLDSEARLLMDGVGRSVGVPAFRGDSLAEAGRPLVTMRGVIWPGADLVWLVSAECKLERCDDDVDDEEDRPMLLVELLDDDDRARPALAAVVPEKVLGLSTLLARVEDALADREPTSAAPALAGLCLGFIPAARPADSGGGRPFPSSVEEEDANPERGRSVSFLVSLAFRELAEVFVASAIDFGTVSVPSDSAIPTSELPVPLSTVSPESVPLEASACIACSAED